MPENPDEVLIARQLAASLTMPVFIVDPSGSLVYYNKHAEEILGRRFEDTGKMEASVWSRLFLPTDESGIPRLPETLPLMIALDERRPVHDRFWIRGLDNVSRLIEVTAFPLHNGAGRFVGGVAIFWDSK